MHYPCGLSDSNKISEQDYGHQECTGRFVDLKASGNQPFLTLLTDQGLRCLEESSTHGQ